MAWVLHSSCFISVLLLLSDSGLLRAVDTFRIGPMAYGKSCIGCTEIGGLAPVMRWRTLTTLKPRLASQVTLHSALEEPSQKWCGLWIWCSCWLECGPKDTWLGRRDQAYYALSRQSCVGVMLSFWCHGSRMADAQALVDYRPVLIGKTSWRAYTWFGYGMLWLCGHRPRKTLHMNPDARAQIPDAFDSLTRFLNQSDA